MEGGFVQLARLPPCSRWPGTGSVAAKLPVLASSVLEMYLVFTGFGRGAAEDFTYEHIAAVRY
jgi:hypothetical protein